MEAPVEIQTSSLPPQKFSRYRSVRNATLKATNTTPASHHDEVNDPMKRSMSRYKGARGVKPVIGSSQIEFNSKTPSTQTFHAEPHSSKRSNPTSTPAETLFSVNKSRQIRTTNERDLPQARKKTDETSTMIPGLDSLVDQWSIPMTNTIQENPEKQTVRAARNSTDEARLAAYAILNGDADAHGGTRSQHLVEGRLRHGTLGDRDEQGLMNRNIGVKEKAWKPDPRDLERQRFVENTSHTNSKAEYPMNKRKGTTWEAPELRPQRLPPEISRIGWEDAIGHTHVAKETRSLPTEPAPVTRTVIPGIDAPLSAVNAGDRKVMVKWNKSSVMLPVTPTTTSLDIVRSAANDLSGNIDVNMSVLFESFKLLGLERPIRQYEHIRDVLNSWDQDDQNALLILPSTTGGNDNDLDFTKVPKEQPSGTSAYMYYSHKPGTWDKRWICLRPDGQIYMAKHSDAEAKNVCHMRDFDIYIPTNRQMKKLDPPKRICFAIKSLHKSAMFLSTANFVHFFATKDKSVAAAWFKAVQEWRSWYLVQVMGKGQNRESKNSKASPPSDLKNSSQHHRRISTASTPLQTGSFRPLIKEDDFKRIPAQESIPQESESPEKSYTHHPLARPIRTRGPPPTSYPKTLNQDPPPSRPRGSSLNQAPLPPSDPFATTGLLGRTYSVRQRSLQHPQPVSTNLPPSSIPPPADFKPLVDLTPHYVEPPHHAKKGRGVNPVVPGPLIDIATSPELVIKVPPATTWRRPAIGDANPMKQPVPNSAPAQAPQRAQTIRNMRPRAQTIALPEDREDESPFTGTGLLAAHSMREGQGGNGRGRGVATGDRAAREPMLDVKLGGEFVKGSLLDAVEQSGHVGGLVVDREKRREMVVGTGEGW